MTHLIGWVTLQVQCWVVSYTPPWHRLDWSIMQVIMIARLHAMYQRSRKVLIFIVVIFIAIKIAEVVMLAILTMQISGGKLSSCVDFQVHQAHWHVPAEYILSGTYQCMIDYAGDFVFLDSMASILDTVWEVLTLCLAVWIAVKHFRELRQHSTSGIIGDCFTVLMKTHVSYFARWDHNVNVVLLFRWRFACASVLVVKCFQYGLFSPTFSTVCRFVTSLYMQPWFIISTGHAFPGHSDLYWSHSDTPDGAAVCTGTTPDPRCSRISC